MKIEILERLSEISEEEAALLAGKSLDKKLYTGEEGFVIDRGRMLARGKLIDIRPHTRFVSFPAHSHNYIEIIYMCSGTTTHTINKDKPVELKSGELLMLNQHTTHSINKAGKEDVAVNFIILPQFFDYALELIGSDNILGQFLLSSLQKQKDSIGYLHFKVAEITAVQNLVENLILSLITHEPNYKQINQVTMGLLFLQLLNHTELLETSQKTTSTNQIVVEVLREIEENYRTANLTQISKKHNVSVAYISKMIKKNTGRTYKELLQEKRLSKAANLLLSSNQNIGNIIETVGYSNSSYFFTKFKERFDVSPREFRDVSNSADNNY